MLQIKESALASLQNALCVEQDLYFTQNSKYFDKKRSFWLSRLKEKRQQNAKFGLGKLSENGTQPQRSLIYETHFQVSNLY